MAHIEHLISRYLDGELSAAESEQVRQLLEESPEARTCLRELMAVSSAARRMPLMHQPKPRLEQQLFRRLATEGLYNRPSTPPVMAEARGRATRAWQTAAAVLVALLVMLSGIQRFDESADVLHDVKKPVAALDHGASGVHAVVGQAPAVTVASVNSAVPPPPPVNGDDVMRPAPALRADASHCTLTAPPVIRLDAEGLTMPRHDAQPDESVTQPARLTTVAPRTIQLVPAADTAQPPSTHEQGSLATLGPLYEAPTQMSTAWAASLRGGVASIGDAEGGSVREVDMKLGMQLADRHQISIVVGSGPVLSTTSRASTGLKSGRSQGVASNARTANGGTPNVLTDGVTTQQLVRSIGVEPWVGLGYNYAIPMGGDLSVDPGLKGGASKSTIRIGAELPVRYRMSPTMSLELAASVSRVMPAHTTASESLLSDATSRSLYLESTENSSFTSYGVQLGIRIDIGKR